MKRLLTAWIVLLTVSTVAWAASPPDTINYQGVLRDSDGRPLEGTVKLR